MIRESDSSLYFISPSHPQMDATQNETRSGSINTFCLAALNA